MVSTGLKAFVGAFRIDACEVTAGAYEAFALKKGKAIPARLENASPEHPAVNVSWAEAQAFCAASNGSLPTETEWERAAIGTRSPYLDHPMGFDRSGVNLDSTYGRDIWDTTSPVASFPPNGFGIHDAVGNAAEWVADWYGPVSSYGEVVTNPVGPAEGSKKVVRGGSWLNCENREHLKERTYADPDRQFEGYGFRCAYKINPAADFIK